MRLEDKLWCEFLDWFDKTMPMLETPRFSTMEPMVYKPTDYINDLEVPMDSIFKAWVLDIYGEDMWLDYEDLGRP